MRPSSPVEGSMAYLTEGEEKRGVYDCIHRAGEKFHQVTQDGSRGNGPGGVET